MLEPVMSWAILSLYHFGGVMTSLRLALITAGGIVLLIAVELILNPLMFYEIEMMERMAGLLEMNLSF